MIILDTNVLSELMKIEPSADVKNWLNGYDFQVLRVSSITVMEIQYGINLLSEGARKQKLQNSFESIINNHFKNRVIEFDQDCAIATSKIAAVKKQQDFNTAIQDMQIAGTAIAKDKILATRNEKDFFNCGLEIINPWNFKK